MYLCMEEETDTLVHLQTKTAVSSRNVFSRLTRANCPAPSKSLAYDVPRLVRFCRSHIDCKITNFWSAARISDPAKIKDKDGQNTALPNEGYKKIPELYQKVLPRDLQDVRGSFHNTRNSCFRINQMSAKCMLINFSALSNSHPFVVSVT